MPNNLSLPCVYKQSLCKKCLFSEIIFEYNIKGRRDVFLVLKFKQMRREHHVYLNSDSIFEDTSIFAKVY